MFSYGLLMVEIEVLPGQNIEGCSGKKKWAPASLN